MHKFSLFSRRVLIGSALLAFASVACVWLQSDATAQEGGSLHIDQLVVDERSEELSALVSVLDAAGKPVADVADLEATIDGAPVEIEAVRSVLGTDTGVSILLLVDVSGSMAGEPLLQSQNAAVSFVEGMLPQDYGAVAPFGGGAPVGAAFADESRELTAVIRSLQAESETGTALYDAIMNGIEITEAAPTVRRAVVLLTDGRDSGTTSQRTSADALAAATSAGVPFYAIALGDGADVEFLRTLSESSGGRSYRAPTPDEVPAIFATIGETLRGQYIVTISLPDATPSERELTLSYQTEGARLLAQATFSAEAAGADGAGLGAFLLPGLIAAAVVGGGIVVFVFRRWRRRVHQPPGGPGSVPTLPRSPGPSRSIQPGASGRLVVVSGPNAGQSARLDAGPVELGAQPGCGLRLSEAESGVAGIHARAWLHGRRLMIHHLARGKQTIVGDRPVEWAALELGETVQIGPHTIAFETEPA